jgi:peptidoglycan pentaglycine glycine transferase (the first glycine)
MNRSFLQTSRWLEFQEHLGRETWDFTCPEQSRRGVGEFGAKIVKHKMPFGKNYLYIPHGPTVDLNNIHGGLENAVGNFVRKLYELGRKEKSIFIKIEPLSDVVIELLYRYGFKKSKKEIQPKRTVVLDLNLSEEELLSKMHHKTRYNIKVAQRHSIVVKPSHNVNEFLELLRKTTKRDRFASHPKDYYEKLLKFFENIDEMKTDLIMAYHNKKSFGKAQDDGVAIAGAIALRHGDTGYYLHGASDHEYRSMMAPYALQWSIIKYLKEHGSTSYDLWGIDAVKWPGVTRFKLGWGGRQMERPGSFDLPISRFWYIIYGIAKKFF